LGSYFMYVIHGNGFAPFRFLTPFPHPPSRRLRNSARKPSASGPDACVQNYSSRLSLRCSNILGSRLHRLPSVDNSVQEKRCCGGSKGVCPFGRRTHVREGEAGSEATVGRGKAKRFPLQVDEVRLNLQGRFFHYRVLYPNNLDRSLK